jgi:DNA-binding winged helix-turn-helix (wHTH) protein
MRWKIGSFEFNALTRRLRQTGEIQLERNDARVLEFLIEKFREDYTNDDIVTKVWKQEVEDDSLYKSIQNLRKAFGGERDSYIVSRPYQLVVRPEPIVANGTATAEVEKHTFVSAEGTQIAVRDVKQSEEDALAAERTYYRYRDQPTPLMDSLALIRHLEERYRCRALSLGNRIIPATVLWKNAQRLIHPDLILGELDFTDPTPLTRSPTLSDDEYRIAREFIRKQYGSGRIRYEGCDYRMTHIKSSPQRPRMHGAFGLYYDNILTQYAIEWELKKALLHGGPSAIHKLSAPGTLPLREAIEAEGSPLMSGHGRCAAITISTLLVFKRRTGGFSCLIRRRSMEVGVSPGMLHVVPAGMFEASNTSDRWSIELNVWRELLEEVYDDKELLGSECAELLDHVRRREPVAMLCQLLDKGAAEFSVTGIVCDLLNLRPEVCTVLFIPDPAFVEAKRMQVNWEYEPEIRFGKFAVGWDRIDEVIEKDGAKYGIVASGAACIALGREWVKRRHGI